MRVKPIFLLLAAALVLLAISALARHHRPRAESTSGSFDYYVLALSWAPDFCASHSGDGSLECQSDRHTGFVLHGLWPEANRGPSPENCAPARPVARQMVEHMLSFYPSAGLIQHEWASHGTCSGLDSADYFAKAEQAFRSVQVPDSYRNLEHAQQFAVHDIERSFAEANHAEEESFRTSCHGGELVGVEACFSKELRLEACGQTVRECPADRVLMRPPQ